jgi:glycosyltransferase involved in cell wall biosynthesis
MDGSRVAVLIPAFREGETIGGIVIGARVYAPVIVVDDCSPDDTAMQATAAGATVTRNSQNLGYEGSLNRAFEIATGMGFEYAITMDADGEHDPALISEFCALLIGEHVPLVLGIRPRRQRIAEHLMCWYVRWRFGPHDILCGMKGYDLDLVKQNGRFDRSHSVGTELAINSIRRGTPFREVRIRGNARRGAPRFDNSVRANLRILAALWRLIWNAD